MKPLSTMDRFMRHVDRDECDAPGGCWTWTGARSKIPHYPIPYARFAWRGRNARASHVSVWLFRGEEVNGKQVMHACDNPMCVNPSHLRIGTAKDNYADMRQKGREKKAHGSANGWYTRPGSRRRPPRGAEQRTAKLNDQTAVEVFRRRRNGESVKLLAAEFGISESLVYRVALGFGWTHATGGVPSPR